MGGRLPFVLGAAPGIAVALSMLGFARSLLVTTLLVLAFFGAYFIAYEPYRALYPDLVSRDAAGRAQSIQALWVVILFLTAGLGNSVTTVALIIGAVALSSSCCYSLSRGIGTVLGPALAGAAVELLRGPLSSTRGYAAIWGVAEAHRSCSVSTSCAGCGKRRLTAVRSAARPTRLPAVHNDRRAVGRARD